MTWGRTAASQSLVLVVFPFSFGSRETEFLCGRLEQSPSRDSAHGSGRRAHSLCGARPFPPNIVKRLSEFLISAAFSINPYLYVVLILPWIRKDNNENPIFQSHTKGMPSIFNHAVEILAAFSEPSLCSNYISRF